MKWQSLSFTTANGEPRLIFNLTPEEVKRAIHGAGAQGGRKFRILNQKRKYTKSEEEAIVARIKDFERKPLDLALKLRVDQ